MFPRVLDPSFTYYSFLPSVSFRFLGIKTSRMSSFDSDFVIVIPPPFFLSFFLSPQRLSRDIRDKTLIRIIRGETRRDENTEQKRRKKEERKKEETEATQEQKGKERGGERRSTTQHDDDDSRTTAGPQD